MSNGDRRRVGLAAERDDGKAECTVGPGGAQFLIFRRAGDEPWRQDDTAETLAQALNFCDDILDSGQATCVCIMEVGGVDAVPMFTFRHAASFSGELPRTA